MTKALYTITEVSKLIANDKILLISGDETLLDKLPEGRWIGGTTPYFMAPEGCLFSQELLHVVDLTDFVTDVKLASYDENQICNVVSEEFDNGFTVLILPAHQPVWHAYAMESPNYSNLYTNPVIGWVSGVKYENVGIESPKTYLGTTKFKAQAVAMHLKLPENLIARVEIINLYEPGNGDVIKFPEKGFESNRCIVNGKDQSLYQYFKSVNADEPLPIVANYSGAHINVGAIWDRKNEVANLYAPVFPNVEYRLAKSKNVFYEQEFEDRISKEKQDSIVFACNCLMNYFTFGLEGKKLKGVSGPVTFGEIAYHLLNQTFAYLLIEEK